MSALIKGVRSSWCVRRMFLVRRLAVKSGGDDMKTTDHTAVDDEPVLYTKSNAHTKWRCN